MSVKYNIVGKRATQKTYATQSRQDHYEDARQQ